LPAAATDVASWTSDPQVAKYIEAAENAICLATKANSNWNGNCPDDVEITKITAESASSLRARRLSMSAVKVEFTLKVNSEEVAAVLDTVKDSKNFGDLPTLIQQFDSDLLLVTITGVPEGFVISVAEEPGLNHTVTAEEAAMFTDSTSSAAVILPSAFSAVLTLLATVVLFA